MTKTFRPYARHEDNIITSAFRDGADDDDIVRLLAEAGFDRSKDGVSNRRVKLNCLRNNLARSTPGDSGFVARMADAIRRGKERPPRIGTFKDRRPLLPTPFHPEPPHSCSGSQGAMCADIAGEH